MLQQKVIWHDGMPLQPQHFQQQDRYFESYVEQKQNAMQRNVWGFSELVLDTELLNLGKLSVLEAVGIFPDGTPFNIPMADQIVTPFVIPEGMHNTVLYLALPLRQAGAAEIGESDGSQLYRRSMGNKSVTNNIANHQQEADVAVASLACRIVSEQEDLRNYTYLPLTKVIESRANHNITLDANFLTTWLNVHKANALHAFTEEVHGLLSSRADMLAARLTDTRQAGTAEAIDFMLLQLSNKYESLFAHLLKQNPLHPETLYEYLIQLMGEMSTYTCNARRAPEAPRYQHADLFGTFQPLIKNLRQALSMVLEQNAHSIALEERAHGLWVGTINDRELLKESEFILSVYADIPQENLLSLIPSQIKIAPVEQIKTLVSRALPGVSVTPLTIAPRQLPYHANFCYFKVDHTNPQWEALNQSAGVALHIGSPVPGLKLELWAIKG